VLSRLDHRVAPADGAAAFARLGAAVGAPAVKELVWLEASGHVVAADRERARVFALAEAWLARHVGTRAPAAVPARGPRPPRPAASVGHRGPRVAPRILRGASSHQVPAGT
jgi:hypothetical protein